MCERLGTWVDGRGSGMGILLTESLRASRETSSLNLLRQMRASRKAPTPSSLRVKASTAMAHCRMGDTVCLIRTDALMRGNRVHFIRPFSVDDVLDDLGGEMGTLLQVQSVYSYL